LNRIQIIEQKNQLLASMFTAEQKEQAIKNAVFIAEAAKDEIINQKEQLISSMFTLEQKNQAIDNAVSIAEANKDEIIKQKEQVIASMFTLEQKNQAIANAVSLAETAKDEVIKQNEQIIASMFTFEEKNQAVEKAISEKDEQCQGIVQDEILIERKKWDINTDNKKGIFEAIDALKIVADITPAMITADGNYLFNESTKVLMLNIQNSTFSEKHEYYNGILQYELQSISDNSITLNDNYTNQIQWTRVEGNGGIIGKWHFIYDDCNYNIVLNNDSFTIYLKSCL